MSHPESDTIMNDDVVVDVTSRIRELAAFFMLIRINSGNPRVLQRKLQVGFGNLGLRDERNL